jgi:hypothetical protein
VKLEVINVKPFWVPEARGTIPSLSSGITDAFDVAQSSCSAAAYVQRVLASDATP